MKLVVCEPDNIPPWIFPEELPNFPEPGVGVEFPAMADSDFAALASALKVEAAIKEPLLWLNSGCDVGYPHDAPDSVPQIHPEILAALIAIPSHERWRVAEAWAGLRLGNRPSKEALSLHKKLVNTLCEYAEIAIKKGHVAVMVEPYE